MMESGHPAQLGASWDGTGTNFALYSGCAEAVELCLFDAHGRETGRYRLPGEHDGVWCGFLPGTAPGQQYGYRVHGRFAPAEGLRCNPHKLLLDPYARMVEGQFRWSPAVYDFVPGSPPHRLRMSRLDSAACVPKSVVTGPLAPPAAGPRIPWCDKVIYEANVRGFTMRHPGLSNADRGRFRGLSNGRVVDYLKALGVTSVELQPVHHYLDEAFLAAAGRRNFWGYNSIGFFCVEPRFALKDARGEFCEMVETLHAAGLEVILDVAYNHTAEGGSLGPSLGFRGIDNLAYYRTETDDPGTYLNVTGCGNTLNADHPRSQDLVVDSLAYWHQDLGVDGFRFDLAVTLGRTETGFEAGHPLLQRIGSDARLQRASLIAEPWDVGPAGYQLGNFPKAWSEWNDRYRDGVRSFWRGDRGRAGSLAKRLHGSADIFEPGGRGPRSSVNFISSHDGFTLADVVSYEQRHNEANGEHNRDGHAHNYSRHYGVEGPTGDEGINRLRRRQRLNMLATLLFSQGTPMLLAGDEFGNSQGGNNNAYCQDNETGWVDWTGLAADPGFTDEVRKLIGLRRELDLLRQPQFIHGGEGPSIDWMHTDGAPMAAEEWSASRCFSLMLSAVEREEAVLLLINGSGSPRHYTLPPPVEGAGWTLAFHSAGPEALQQEPARLDLPARAIACLVSGHGRGPD